MILRLALLAIDRSTELGEHPAKSPPDRRVGEITAG